jgi:hypothetical protein
MHDATGHFVIVFALIGFIRMATMWFILKAAQRASDAEYPIFSIADRACGEQMHPNADTTPQTSRTYNSVR